MAIPDFSEREIWAAETAVKERYGRPLEIQRADIELRLDPAIPELTVCPSLVWSEGGATFVVCKLGDNRFRSQFLYSAREQFGTGISEYDDIAECVVTLLKFQADHAATRTEKS